jgi:hypothetical protein
MLLASITFPLIPFCIPSSVKIKETFSIAYHIPIRSRKASQFFILTNYETDVTPWYRIVKVHN